MAGRFRSFDGSHVPDFVKSGNFQLNKNSQQSRGLIRWYPISHSDIGMMKTTFRDYSSSGKDSLNTSIEGDEFARNDFGGYAIANLSAAFDAVRIPAVNFNGLQPCTLSCWVKFNGSVSADGRLIDNDATGVILHSVATNAAQFILNSFSSNDRAKSPDNVLTADQPCLIHGIFDGTNLSVAVNGIIQDTVVPTGTYTDSGNDYRVLSNSATIDEWDIRVRNVALTAAEILAEWHPSSRWDLYEETNARPIVLVPAAGGDTNVNATTDALTLTEFAATVNAETSIAAGVDALTLTEFAATIGADTNVQAGVDALTLTEQAATVSIGTNVSATTDALTLTEFAAGINAETNVGAGVDALTLTEFAATIDTGAEEVTAVSGGWLSEEQVRKLKRRRKNRRRETSQDKAAREEFERIEAEVKARKQALEDVDEPVEPAETEVAETETKPDLEPSVAEKEKRQRLRAEVLATTKQQPKLIVPQSTLPGLGEIVGDRVAQQQEEDDLIAILLLAA